jgi:hypothetical protein
VARHTKIGLASLVGSLLLAGAVLAGPGILFPEQSVRTGPKNELAPAAEFSAGVDNLIWTEHPNGPGKSIAYFRKGTHAKIKLNTTGQGFSGGIDPPRIVYQQIDGGESDLKLYRIDTRKRSDPPAGVNSNDWEFAASISGKWILFGRDDDQSDHKRLILFNRTNRQARQLATLSGTDLLAPGQVNGNWAVWTICNSSECNVFRYQISTRTKVKLAKPPGSASIYQYGASVLKNGVVYAARSGTACGETVRIVRFRSDDPNTGTEVAALPAGRDAFSGWARTRPNGSVDYLYERVTCSNLSRDLYRINDPTTP